MEIEKIISGLHPLERKVLPVLKDTSDFDEIARKSSLQKVEVMRALQWLQNKKIARISQTYQEQVSLDENGLKYRDKGLPEKKFLEMVIDKPKSLHEIGKKADLVGQELSISLGLLRSKNFIQLNKNGKDLIISCTSSGKNQSKNGFPEEKFLKKSFPAYTSEFKKEDKESLNLLKNRSRIVKIKVIKKIDASLMELGNRILEKGISDKDIIDRLTTEIIRSGEWKTKKFRSYDVAINVPKIFGGRRHFVNQAIDYIKRIWLDMGFNEMQGSFVQTAFWDLDALFVPQDHPARDMQDTFYIKKPKNGKLPKEVLTKVKSAHENGYTTESKGWGYNWSEEIAKENLLRTHNTVLSAQTISKLKQEDLPAKFFSVGKVFRNETLSWKSLFEFTQVEGIVVDPNANFKHLKGYLKEFFAKMGFPDIRIRPAHFPYTEPSAEVDVWHPKKNQWVELGGSGIFRPEVVKPLLGVDSPVLAWGLGMERTIMEYYNIKDVREIYNNDIKTLRENKIWMK
jgi:phenylalanyl-tRNA synthetase alpha chain